MVLVSCSLLLKMFGYFETGGRVTWTSFVSVGRTCGSGTGRSWTQRSCSSTSRATPTVASTAEAPSSPRALSTSRSTVRDASLKRTAGGRTLRRLLSSRRRLWRGFLPALRRRLRRSVSGGQEDPGTWRDVLLSHPGYVSARRLPPGGVLLWTGEPEGPTGPTGPAAGFNILNVFQVLPQINVHNGGPDGAGVLGKTRGQSSVLVFDVFWVRPAPSRAEPSEQCGRILNRSTETETSRISCHPVFKENTSF